MTKPELKDGQIVFDSQKEFDEYMSEVAKTTVAELKEKENWEKTQTDLEEANKQVETLKNEIVAKDKEIADAKVALESKQKEFDNFKVEIEKGKKVEARLKVLAEKKIVLPADEKLKERLVASIQDMTDEVFNDYVGFLTVQATAASTDQPPVDVPNTDTIAADDKKFKGLRAVLDKTQTKKNKKKDED